MSQWDERYSRPGYYYGAAPNDFLAAMAFVLPPRAEVLSIGEGEGRNAVYLAALGHRVTGVDASAVGLAKARASAAQQGLTITTVLADLAEFDPGHERWDAIVSVRCHLPPDLRERVHRACVAALRPGGVLLLEAYRPEQLRYGTGGPPDPDLLYSLDQLRADFSGLELVHAAEIVRDVREGLVHDGPSAVVQVVGRKQAAEDPSQGGPEAR